MPVIHSTGIVNSSTNTGHHSMATNETDIDFMKLKQEIVLTMNEEKRNKLNVTNKP